MNSKQSPKAGYWMLVALVILLGAPVVVGHFVMNNAEAAQEAQ